VENDHAFQCLIATRREFQSLEIGVFPFALGHGIPFSDFFQEITVFDPDLRIVREFLQGQLPCRHRSNGISIVRHLVRHHPHQVHG